MRSIDSNFKKRRSFIKLGIAAATILLMIGSAFTALYSFPALAERLPVMNSLFKYFSFEHGYGGNFENYTQVINEVKKDKDYEVKINEIVMDEFRFKIIYTIKSPVKVSQLIQQQGNTFPRTPGKSIKLNGKSFLGGAGGTEKIIEEYSIQVMEDYDIKKMNIPDHFNIEIDFNEINNINGMWKFNFSASKEQIKKDIKTYSPNIDAKVKNEIGKEISIKFEKISFSPIATSLLIKLDSDLELQALNLFIKDNNGSIYAPQDYSLNSTNAIKWTGLIRFKPITEIPEKLIVEYLDGVSAQPQTIELMLK